ncbi:MAG: hypothetical protein IKN73_00975 [Alphaproteobacteria bacterium]|nr:hypothetical protein [Alphaproteobacteria bacterium]
MKKTILSLLSLTLLAGCSGYDYYKTNVNYRQKGEDCVYYYNEKGKKFNEDIRSLKDTKKIVYRNTQCSDLYMQDTFGYAERNDRKAIVPVFPEEKTTSSCGCNKCGKKKVLKNKYIIVPAYAD